MGKKGYKELMVWQRAKDLAVKMYRITEIGAMSRDFDLCNQMRRSAVSIASNVAEGDERNTDREAVRFFYIAKGSLAEFRTQTQIAFETGRLNSKAYEELESECEALARMLGKLIKARTNSRTL